jgi:hypothetical protein
MATIDWGDGTAPTTGTVSGSSGAFAVSGDHTYTAADVYTVSTTISGPDGTLTTTSTAVVDDAALVGTGIDVSATEGAALANVTVASFADPAGLDAVSGDSATIDWGDGGTSTGYVYTSGNTVYVSGSHSYAQQGLYQVTTSLQTGGGDSEPVTSMATVADAPLTAQGLAVSATEGQTASLTLANFSDPNANALNGDFQVSIDWGDSSPLDSADAVNGSPAQFSVVGSHAYAESGSYTATVTITDDGGASVQARATVTVADAAITATGVNFSTVAGQALGAEPVATFFDANPAAQASDFQVSIDWGNGSSSPGQVVGQSGEFAVYNDYVYQQTGTYAVAVTIQEDGQTVATAASTATVGNFQEGQNATLTVMTFHDSNPAPASSYTAMIAWGDGTVTVGTVQGSNGQYSVQGTHSYALAGSYTLTVTVAKGSNNTLSVSSSVLVADAPLTLLANNVSPTEGQALTNVPVAIFVDANPSASSSEDTPTVRWGDGTAASGGTVVGNGPIFMVLASHTYANAGSSVTEVIVDKGTAKGVANSEGTAVVKPNWKNEDKYNFTLDVALTGRLEDYLPGDIQNGEALYLPGQLGTRPVLQGPQPRQVGQFQPQQVNLYLAGLGQNLVKAAGVARVTFQIAYGWTGHGPGFLVTSLPGFAGNATAPAISKPGTEADYSFDPKVDLMQANQATVVIGKGATTAPMYVKDYGGEATFLATLWDKNNKVLHVFTQTVPDDPNHTGISLTWLTAQFNADHSLPADLLTNPNWDAASFPEMFNSDSKNNDPLKFPTLRTLEKGDGLPLWYKYRGVLVNGGGFDVTGRHPQPGFVRLSPSVKNVLVDVDVTKDVLNANKQGKPNYLDINAALDMVSKAYSQARFGAGVVLYYRFGPNSGTGLGNFTMTGTNPNALLTTLSNWLKNSRFRAKDLGVDIHQFWRHLTIANELTVKRFIPFFGRPRLYPVSSSGFSNSATTNPKIRAGSFVFYKNVQASFTSLRTSRKTFLDTNKLGTQTLNFDTLVAGLIIHELAHQLIQGTGHFNDADGNGTPNQVSDFASVQFNYEQLSLASPPKAVKDGYNGQDYYPLPGQTFQFGHGWDDIFLAGGEQLFPNPAKGGAGTVSTTMRLKNSFLPPP